MTKSIFGKNGNTLLFRISIFLFALLPLSSITAQLPSRIEKAFDEYYQEIVKVYQVIESEDPSVALDRIDKLIPEIEKRAMVVVDLTEADPEVMEFLDSDESYLLFRDKPYYKEMIRITQNESFLKKLETNSELQAKIEEVEGIIEAYASSPPAMEDQIEQGVAFTLKIREGEFEGTYQIITDFDESAVAYIDDLGYLRIDIMGSSENEESTVSFFVENTGTGRQEWSTDGHFMYELMDSEGDYIFSLWGSEEMGYFEITSVDGPGGFVSGTIQGTCSLDNGESEENVGISAEFKVKYLDISDL